MPKMTKAGNKSILEKMLDFSNFISQYEDINTIMDVTLKKIRDLTRADAGTFYLIEKGQLRFSYVQNDTLFGKDSSNKQLYVNSVMPVDERSISGYAALTKKTINIEDVENIPPQYPFVNNRSYDESSGYNTKSMLTIPITGVGGKVFAVLQLINCKKNNGDICVFSKRVQQNAELMASQSLAPLMHAIETKRIIEQMLNVAKIHDPFETGGHIQRVGSYSAEIYTHWAKKNNLREDEIIAVRDDIRLASMLHDIGKVGIPESVLKKPGRLTESEYEIMKKHCSIGASVYDQRETTLELMAYEITLNHHQAWDGRGYTGSPQHPILSGEDIPIHARVVSVADVFDALISPRCYKKPFTLEATLNELKRCSGSKFDPSIVEAALEITETLEAIRERYPDPAAS